MTVGNKIIINWTYACFPLTTGDKTIETIDIMVMPMKIVLAPIEVIGMITKPFSLMIRLFANITAGHSIVMGIIAVIFVMKESMGVAGATGISLALGIFIMFLEILIAFLQAFIFTMLSSLFIGMAVKEHEEN